MEYPDSIEIDFVKRTLEIINDYSGNYEVTLLINCCLGLLVLPKEKYFKSIPIEEIPIEGKLWGLSRDSVNVGCSVCGYQLRDVIRKIRNGVCHFKVKTIPDGSRKINILEITDGGKFKATLTVDELKEFVISFASHVSKEP